MKHYQYCVYAKNIEIYAPIGLYEAEKIINNHFLVNVKVCSNTPFDGENYMNYVHIVDVVKLCFNQSDMILEVIANHCINQLKLKLPIANSIEIDIQKRHAAFDGQSLEGLGITLIKEFSFG
ncbi:MAG: dihydroneopterin aldolase [Bacteroidota bacterium]|nr:dihydroneopterin aldolase [Bacteroidota bacterium]